MSRPSSNRIRPNRTLTVTLFCFLLLEGCGTRTGSSSPVVMEVAGEKVTLADLRLNHDIQRGPGSFDKLDIVARKEFLDSSVEDEILSRLAEDLLGPRTPDQIRKLDQLKGGRLLGALDERITAPIKADSAGSQRLVRERLAREVLLYRFHSPSDSVTTLARSEVVRGRPFEKVVRGFMTDPVELEKGGEMGWLSATALGAELTNELLLQNVETGYLSKIRATRAGYEFLQAREFRPLDLAASPADERRMTDIVREIRRRQVLDAYRDSLKVAHRLEVDPQAAALVQQAMSAYWDSLTQGGKAPTRRMTVTRPPIWRFDDASRQRRLFTVDGHEKTIGLFMAELTRVPNTIWPSASDPEVCKRQIEFRALVDLRQAEAQRLGLDKDPRVVAGGEQDLKKQLIEGLTNKLRDECAVTGDEIRDYYEKNKDMRFRLKENMRLSYAIFPTEAEARQLLTAARQNDFIWWRAETERLQKMRTDVRVVPDSPQLDLDRELPEEIRVLVEKAKDLNSGDILDVPVQVGGGWAAARVLNRIREGYVPFDRAYAGAQTGAVNAKVEERIQKMLAEGRARFHLKTYPENLAAKD